MIDAIGSSHEYSVYQLPEGLQKIASADTSGTAKKVSAIDPYDLNGDGILSYEELQEYLEAMGLIPSSSSFTLEADHVRITSAETAMAAYQISAGSGTGITSIQMSGTYTYTPIDMRV